jgi:hypothetical protein
MEQGAENIYALAGVAFMEMETYMKVLLGKPNSTKFARS